MKKTLSLCLLLALCLQLFGCAAEPAADSKSSNLMAQIVAAPVEPMAPDAAYANALANFSVALLQNSLSGDESCILSPYSVLMALGMTANGAAGQTAEEFTQAFGLPVGEVNRWLYSCAAQAGNELISANALWINGDSIQADPQFLQTNGDYYSAGIYQTPFGPQTVEEINGWVRENTAERIPSILDQLDEMAAMVLVNALTFDAQWETAYEADNIYDGIFTAANGTQQTVSMMGSTEGRYLEDSNACGFIKDYAGGQYSFVAILPREGLSTGDYIASLTGADLLDLIENASEEQVQTTMPAFELETSLALNDTLQAMGITEAFRESADFSNMCDKEVFIDSVLHKTWLKVDAEGTQAAASTAVIITEKCAIISGKTVVLDRPYVMAIVDNTTQTILFLGAVNSIT